MKRNFSREDQIKVKSSQFRKWYVFFVTSLLFASKEKHCNWFRIHRLWNIEKIFLVTWGNYKVIIAIPTAILCIPLLQYININNHQTNIMSRCNSSKQIKSSCACRQVSSDMEIINSGASIQLLNKDYLNLNQTCNWRN